MGSIQPPSAGGNLAEATSTFNEQGGLGENVTRIERYKGGAIIYVKKMKQIRMCSGPTIMGFLREEGLNIWIDIGVKLKGR